MLIGEFISRVEHLQMAIQVTWEEVLRSSIFDHHGIEGLKFELRVAATFPSATFELRAGARNNKYTSICPWSNRVTLVQKPGKNRSCLDARKLNKVTIKDAYPLQNIESILSRLDQPIYISSSDLKHVIWQMELDQKIREYTAFTIPGRSL